MRAEATILTLKCDKPLCIKTQTWTGDPNICVDKALDAGWAIGERVMDEPRDLCPEHAKGLAEWIGADTSPWDEIRAANPTTWDTDPLPVTETHESGVLGVGMDLTEGGTR